MEEGYSFNSHVVLLLRKDRGGPITWFFIHKYLQLRAKDKLSPSKIELTLVPSCWHHCSILKCSRDYDHITIVGQKVGLQCGRRPLAQSREDVQQEKVMEFTCTGTRHPVRPFWKTFVWKKRAS